MNYYRDDDEYDRAQESVAAAIRDAGLTKEDCPFCIQGKVPVPDGSIAPALAICGLCNGRGWIATSR